MKRFLFFVLVMLIAINMVDGALSYKVLYHGTEVEIKKDMRVFYKVMFVLNNTVNDFSYETMLDNLYNFTYEINDANATCKIEEAIGKVISCRINSSGEKPRLAFRFFTRNVVKKHENTYVFSYNIMNFPPAERMFSIVYLPESAMLASEKNESVSPASGSVMTDGRRIMVSWEMRNYENSILNVFVRYSFPFSRKEEYNVLVFLMTTFIVLFIVGIAIFMRKTSPRKVMSLESLMPVLNEDERAVLNVIMKRGGKAKQKVIVRETDFSKPKVSRIIKELKERNLIDVERVGKTNIVRIKSVKEWE